MHKPIDAIDELVLRSKDHPELRKFHAFHREHPEVLDALVEEIQLLIDHGFTAFSYGSLWDYCRWKLLLERGPGATYLMNDHLTPFYGRAITILHPEFNGLVEFRTSYVDEIFGLQIETVPEKRPKHYARRLQCADGTPLEMCWRPTIPHVIKHAASRRPDVHPRD